MRRRPLNISAARAIAIERQVEAIIASARVQCALQYRAARRQGLADPTMSAVDALAPAADFENAEAERQRDLDDALRRRLGLPGSQDPPDEPTPGPRLDFWKRLRSLFALRPPRA